MNNNDNNPYQAASNSAESPARDQTPKKQTSRESFNRITGLSCYAAGVVMAGLTGFAIFEQLKAKEPFRDVTTLVIFAAATLVFFGLGYSTGQKSNKR